MSSVYIIQQKGTRLFKFGVSKNPKRRLKTLQTGNAGELILLIDFPCVDISAYAAEATIHRYLRECRIKGEWFEIESDDRVVSLATAIKNALKPPVPCIEKGKQLSLEEIEAMMPDVPTTPPTSCTSSTSSTFSTSCTVSTKSSRLKTKI